MSYINVGAKLQDGTNVATKKALKAALAQDPDSVVFYSTSTMGPQHQGTAGLLYPGDVLSVVGPDPYHRRNWYANVKRGAQGKITVE